MNVKNVTQTKFYKYDILRTYYCEENKCFCHKIADNCIKYEYHYIGNHRNLVITPLTTKGYVFFAQNMKANAPTCLRGPAGTGKTETTRDFYAICGIHNVVINCSDEFDIKFMDKMI